MTDVVPFPFFTADCLPASDSGSESSCPDRTLGFVSFFAFEGGGGLLSSSVVAVALALAFAPAVAITFSIAFSFAFAISD